MTAKHITRNGIACSTVLVFPSLLLTVMTRCIRDHLALPLALCTMLGVLGLTLDSHDANYGQRKAQGVAAAHGLRSGRHSFLHRVLVLPLVCHCSIWQRCDALARRAGRGRALRELTIMSMEPRGVGAWVVLPMIGLVLGDSSVRAECKLNATSRRTQSGGDGGEP